MKIIKRNGSEAEFDITKIISAISKANLNVDESCRMTAVQIKRIAESVVLSCEHLYAGSKDKTFTYALKSPKHGFIMLKLGI